MKRFYLIFVLIYITSTYLMMSQKTGEWEHYYLGKSGHRGLYFYVPENYMPGRNYPLIIAMYGCGITVENMRDMLKESALLTESILVCPDEFPNGDNNFVIEAIFQTARMYNIDTSKIYLTGYSVGGGYSFIFGPELSDLFKGIIGIAPSITSIPYNYFTKFSDLPSAIIIGDKDPLFREVDSLMNCLDSCYGNNLFLTKVGLGHLGDYFYSHEFTVDFLSCMNYLNSVKTEIDDNFIYDTGKELKLCDYGDFVKLESIIGKIESYSVYSVTGQMITRSKTENKNYILINKSILKNGIYFFKVNLIGNTIITKYLSK